MTQKQPRVMQRYLKHTSSTHGNATGSSGYVQGPKRFHGSVHTPLSPSFGAVELLVALHVMQNSEITMPWCTKFGAGSGVRHMP